MSEAPIFSLAGKVALVSGAGQGAGAGISALLAKQGAALIINDVNAGRAEKQAQALRDAGGKAVAAVFDVTDLDAVRAGIAEGEKAIGGPVDILVNNAGNGGASGDLPMMPFAEMPPEVWRLPIDVNLYGAMNCTHTVLPGLIERGWGRIVTIASTAGTHGVNGGMAHYGAAKGGSIGFTRMVAMEVAANGITANSVALGLIKQGDIPILNQLAKGLPAGRRGTPDDVAPLCLYLASTEASWMTGQTIQLNGGAYTT
ncbi:MAG: SDR family NAD(P)-dependent oxidoreductase [Novosphingobium sp.]|nr:SDR family NAD(P)-dependent oxidoreductase [Novosphingobium sp.]